MQLMECDKKMSGLGINQFTLVKKLAGKREGGSPIRKGHGVRRFTEITAIG